MPGKPIKVRLAQDTDRDAIRNMVDKFYRVELAWRQVYPYWLLAEDDTGPLACVQVLAGYPMGAVEFLSFREDLPPPRRAYAIKELSRAALASLKGAGCEMVYGMVPFGLNSWRKILKRKWGAASFERPCNVFFKRLE